jgi:hypothetical protein
VAEALQSRGELTRLRGIIMDEKNAQNGLTS